MNEPGTEGVLLDQETLHDRIDDASPWLREHYRTFRESMLGERDGVSPHADLGDWGTEGDREWKQYLFREDADAGPDECPLSPTRDHPKAPDPLLEPGAWRRFGGDADAGDRDASLAAGPGDD